MESQLFLHTPGGSAHLPTAGRPMVASLSEAKPLCFWGGGHLVLAKGQAKCRGVAK